MNKVNVLCYRDIHSHRDAARTIIMTLQAVDKADEPLQAAEIPKVTGWEKNGPTFKYKRVSLAAYMDPMRIADQSVDLNLKLMKWRLAPNLILENISRQKCLLLGAGTLGSYVARNLMAWGIKNITFVDYGKVSFSNPVRQPLFVFKDCLDGGAPKAPTAASALMEIYPGVTSVGHQFAVPMLGHAMTNVENTKADFEKLQRLIEEHDVIFLLMDTRESRWLPTVMAKAAGKIVVNAALGFDSYVVMRHGTEIDDAQVATTGQKPLGCYFCNDVVAPSDKTLFSLCVIKLLINNVPSPDLESHPLLQLWQLSYLPVSSSILYREKPLLPKPLVSMPNNVVLRGEAYPNCSACSPVIVDSYRRDGWNFVERALREKDYVAELSGLAELHRKAEQMTADMEWDSEGGSAGCSSIGSDGEGDLL
ncbi:Ubiquitin-like modifier-activating enzyme ATG7 [Ceratocystis platani]|uniref:Ubiquitin-like modifier-activating enzyme ATG7 n=1 Tax=Ceratocystis fimbriata f. sp. platani TaxID=88771 RepID=A0A0F8B632_CERFI|nr:Ubiquitin-like modifier-activating enzyme ATG7 [Ceratocystis platani]